MSPRFEMTSDLVEDARWPRGGRATRFRERSRYFSVTISRIGPDVLRHAAVDQHQALLQVSRALRRDFGVGEDPVVAAAGARG